MAGLGFSFMGMISGPVSFKEGPVETAPKLDEDGNVIKEDLKRDPFVIVESMGEKIYNTRKEEEWEEIGMMDGFNKFEQEKLTLLYNDIIHNYDLWTEEYKSYYLVAVNYSFRILKTIDEIPPSSKERVQSGLDAKVFINDMNCVLDGLTDKMLKYFPNSNPGFGIMCLFTQSYVGELVAGEIAIEQMKKEIFK